MAALVELKQRAGISVTASGGFVTPASVTPVIASQGLGTVRSGRLLASVMSCGMQGIEQECGGDGDAKFELEKGQLQQLNDLNLCDASAPDGRRRMQRVLTRMLNTQVRMPQRDRRMCFSCLIALDELQGLKNSLGRPSFGCVEWCRLCFAYLSLKSARTSASLL